jgi:hypothetical protein
MKSFCFILPFIFCCAVHAQEIPLQTQQQLEQLAENGADMENDQIIQQLDFLKHHPIHLNSASREELLQLPLMDDWHVLNFLSYRKFAGKLIDLHELQAIPGWDVALIRMILPYVTLQEPAFLKEKFLSRLDGEHVLLLRSSLLFEPFDSTNPAFHFAGSREHVLFRYRYQYKDLLYAGITGDKDAGEQFFKGYQPNGFDFYSFHFFMKKIGVVKALALGDYTINFGQGLLSWQSTGFGKGAGVMAIKRSSPTLAPYRSSGEFNFYRGGAITIAFGKLELTGLISKKSLTAHLDDLRKTFTGINSSGLHRNESENSQKNQVTQFSYGSRIAFNAAHFTAGVNFLSHLFSLPLMKKDVPYNMYAFSGTSLSQFSVDFGYTFKNTHLFGECASEINFYPALVTGLLISVDRSVDLSFLYRNFNRKFHSLFGNSFSENTLPLNEKGLYSGMDIHPPGKWQIHTYADVFSFPWLKFRTDAPSKGTDFFLQLEYHPTRQAELYIQYKVKSKPLNGEPLSFLDYPTPETRKNLRFHFIDQVSNHFTFAGRFESIWYNLDNVSKEQGSLGYLQADFVVLKKIRTGFRYQYFETGSYNSRIYAYEPDVQSSFSIPAFSGTGFRYLIHFNYPITKKITVWFRWALSSYQEPGSAVHSSNLHNSEIKLQGQVIL